MTAPGPWARTTVAGIVRTAMTGAWTVYPYPPDQLSAPAAFVAPRTPYRERATHRIERVNLAVVLCVQGVQDADAIDALDAMLDQVRVDLEADARIEVPAIAELGPPISIGGTDYLTGRIDVTVNVDC